MAEKRNILEVQSKLIQNTRKNLAEVFNIRPNQVHISNIFKSNTLEIIVTDFKPNNDQTTFLNKSKEHLQLALMTI